MKKIEILALLAVLIFFAVLIAQVSIDNLWATSSVKSESFASKVGTARLILRYAMTVLVNVAIGVWLFIDARKSSRKPWVWMLFSLVYGLMSPILYYCIKIYEDRATYTASKGE